MGRVADSCSRTQPLPFHVLSPSHRSSSAQAYLTVLSVFASEEQFILSQIALLEQVEALVPMLDSAHIKGTSLGLQLYYSAWGGGWMARTSLCLRCPGFKLSLFLIFTLILLPALGLKWPEQSQFQNLRQFGPKDTSLSPVVPNSGYSFYLLPHPLSICSAWCCEARVPARLVNVCKFFSPHFPEQSLGLFLQADSDFN